METILIVEDELDVRQNLVELLSSEGYRCLEAENGFFGRSIVETEVPDLILCDLMMPKIDGYEFYKIVNNLHSEKFIPFIFLTARVDNESLQYAMEMGADDFITKPYKVDALLNRIKSRLRKKNTIDKNFNQLKTSISLYVPHELRTPLISVLGNSELLLNDFENISDSDKKEMISSIYHSGLRFHDRIEKFMTFSQLKLNEFGKNCPKYSELFNPARHNLDEKIKKRYECSKRVSDISIKLDESNLLISEHDFESFLLELLENACKFSSVGEKIEVLSNIYKNNYEIIVRNEGTEIDSTVLSSFYQKDKSYNQQTGNGLGLSIAKMIAKKYDGYIKLCVNDAVYVKVGIPILEKHVN